MIAKRSYLRLERVHRIGALSADPPSQLPLNPVRDDQPRHAVERPLGVAVKVQPFWQLDLWHQQKDRRGDLIADSL